MKRLLFSGIILLLIFIMFCTLISCESKSHEQIIDNDEFTYETLVYDILQDIDYKLIPEYLSENTIGYLKKDGTKELIVFSNSISYIDEDDEYSLIDNRIDNVKEQKYRDLGYIYQIANSDIKSYYPDKMTCERGIKIQGKVEYDFGLLCTSSDAEYINGNNFIGKEINMLVYKRAINNCDFYVYPSSIGSNCEIAFKDSSKNVITFWIDIKSEYAYLEKTSGDYLTIKNELTDETLGVIQSPILKDKEGNVAYHNNVTFRSKGNGKYEIIFIFDSKYIRDGSSAFISFESRKEKQADNAIYEKKPDLLDSYLKNYSVVGNTNDLGIGQVLTRFDFVDELNLEHTRIDEAYYCIYSLTEIKGDYEAVSLLEEWCSITGNWNSNYESGDIISIGAITDEHLLLFPLGGEISKWIDNPELEEFGIKIKSEKEEKGIYDIILSNDNTLYNNYLRIIIGNEE